MGFAATPIHYIDCISDNQVYMKREDLIPYSFGGNKARKAEYFFREIDAGNYGSVVTYGSSHSNHCRVVSNMSALRRLPCHIIAPLEVSEMTCNSRFMELFGAQVLSVPTERVHDTIEAKIQELRQKGHRPYFIPGGGHGNMGAQAYVDCYEEIREYERANETYFDSIFFASGTGTTQAGLVCAQLLHGEEREIAGISIARANPRGRDVILESIHEYLGAKGITVSETRIQEKTIFIDDYIGDGYGKNNPTIEETIRTGMLRYGIPLDCTYTAKAFYGMSDYIKRKGMSGKRILFLHTGGTPLFFDGFMGKE